MSRGRPSLPFPRPPLGWLVAAVMAAGAAVLALAALQWDDEDLLFLGALLALTALSERFDFALPPHSRVSLGVAFILAAGSVSGLPGVAAVASASALADYLVHRKPWYKAGYNLGVLLLAGAAYVGVFRVFGAGYRAEDWPLVLLPVLIGGALNFGINSGLVALAIALSTSERPAAVWTCGFRWLLPHYLLLALLAVTLAFAYDRWELGGLALLLVPLAAMWLITWEQVSGPLRPAQPSRPSDR